MTHTAQEEMDFFHP